MRYLTEFNYCPKCGEELVDEAEFCHSCGTELTEVGNNSQSSNGSEESGVVSDIEADPDITMEDLDLDNQS
ncbi:MAG: zinc-ribbon domain-containing protein, partial [Candidatus Nanohaloarchaea archaeon]